MTDVLHTTDLRKQHQMGEVAVDVLRGVDSAVHQGEFAAIMGPSGAGKSTLLHLMGGLGTPRAYTALSAKEASTARPSPLNLNPRELPNKDKQK